MNNILVIYNVNAGRKQAIKLKKTLLKFLIKNSYSFKFSDIEEIETIDISEFDTIITIGGDGTVNRVLPMLINTDKVLGIIQGGTANLLAAKLGIPTGLKKSLEVIKSGNTKLIDVIKINDRNCALRCGFGYDSDIIVKTPQSLKNKFGYFSYFVAGILFGFRLKKRNYIITTDKNKTYSVDASCLIAANASNMYRNFVSVSGNSSLDDGLLDVFILKTDNPVIFFIEFLCILCNIKINSSRAIYFKTSFLKISNSNIITCHIDGEKTKIDSDIILKAENKVLKVFSP